MVIQIDLTHLFCTTVLTSALPGMCSGPHSWPNQGECEGTSFKGFFFLDYLNAVLCCCKASLRVHNVSCFSLCQVWQHIMLMRRLFIIDCPGVVYDVGDDEIETVLKGECTPYVVFARMLVSPFPPHALSRTTFSENI